MSGAAEVTPELLRAWPLPAVAEQSDKEMRGRVLVLAAGAEVAGATLLTAMAALRAGAGKLQICAPRSFALPLALAIPEARVVPAAETQRGELAACAAETVEALMDHCDAAVIGPGMLDEDSAGELVRRLLGVAGPALVVDAAAMPALAADPEVARRRAGRLVLTPHAGEMARLAGINVDELSADPIGRSREVAARLQAVVALKGGSTLVVSPDGKAWRYAGGVPGLATSGSGDVLAGVIAGLLARGGAPVQAAAWGVFLHGEAGRRLARRLGRLGFLARELLDEIPGVMAELEDG